MGKKKTNKYAPTFAEIVKSAKESAPEKTDPALAKITFRQFEQGTAYCLSKCSEEDIQTALTCLQKICQRTWQQIRESGAKGAGKAGLNYESHNDTSLGTMQRPASLSKDVVICSVRASEVFRIFGFRDSDAFHPIWFDPRHSICKG